MRKLAIVFDWDFTLGPGTWNYVQEKYDVTANVKKNYRLWKAGELTLEDWAEENLEDLRLAGYTDEAAATFTDYEPLPGAEELLEKVKERNIYTAVASIGFTPLVERCSNELGIDEIYSMKFDINKEKGEKVEEMMVTERKAEIVEYFQNDGYTVVFVGDGDSDIPGFKAADVAVLIMNPKFKHELNTAREICEYEFENLTDFADQFEYFIENV
ncbi:MAG: HAD-IB family phosphatase [Candidatus Altiarchaeota archaeon]|nr:HAD-IB family phosphatase [Candidatus Altiarchaeota archaeon]